MEAAIGELERLVESGKIDGDCVQALKCHLPEVNTIRDRFKDSLANAPDLIKLERL